MLDVLKTLFENNVVSEDIKESIEQAWEKRITENKTQVAQELREEFAQKYEHDKNSLYEAVDKLINDQLASEIVEFVNDKKDLAEMKIKQAKKISESANTMQHFIVSQLHKEIKELHEDQKITANKFEKLESFVVEALAREITEFYKDKQDLAETKVKLIKDGKQKLKETKDKFIEKAAVMVEHIVTENLKNELTILKEDIESARKVDFGRKLFEAFASEYQNSYLNEKSETKKLQQIIDTKDEILQEAATAISKAESLIDSKNKELKTLKESVERTKIMNELLAPLNKEQKNIMSELMTTVKTSKLNESFEKYLPSVINGSSKPTTKQKLTESTIITGNKPTHISNEDSNIVELRKLAGL